MIDQNQNKLLVKKTKKYQLVSWLVAGMGIVGTLIMVVLAEQYRHKIAPIHQEVINARAENQSLDALADFLTLHQDRWNQFGEVLPSEASIIYFLEDLESVLNRYDTTATVQFTALKPSLNNSQLSIPISIQLKVSAPDLIMILREIEKMPYFISVGAVDINSAQGIGSLLNVVLLGRVYVQDPFTQP